MAGNELIQAYSYVCSACGQEFTVLEVSQELANFSVERVRGWHKDSEFDYLCPECKVPEEGLLDGGQ